jgi:hypothetical protein
MCIRLVLVSAHSSPTFQFAGRAVPWLNAMRPPTRLPERLKVSLHTVMPWRDSCCPFAQPEFSRPVAIIQITVSFGLLRKIRIASP